MHLDDPACLETERQTVDPTEALEASFTFANELLAAQHDFTKQLIEALRPVAGAAQV